MGDAFKIPPPGFDLLSIDEKIEYVQSLWDRIAADADAVPLTEWQRQLLDERLDDLTQNPDAGVPWEDVQAQILGKLSAKPD